MYCINKYYCTKYIITIHGHVVNTWIANLSANHIIITLYIHISYVMLIFVYIRLISICKEKISLFPLND